MYTNSKIIIERGVFMFFKENESNKKRMNITLRNFLSFLLYKKEELLNEISKEYSIEERSTFIYNCAINTIVEYMQTHKLYTIPKIASLEIQKLFKENFELRIFEKNEDDFDNISASTKEIIKEFKCIKENLDENEKNESIDKVNEIVTSAT